MRTTDLRSRRRRGRRTAAGRAGRLLLVGLAVVLVVALAGVLVLRGVGPFPNPEGCRVAVGSVVADLSTEQAENASIIAAVGVRRGLPARAVSIALATAYQESKIRNLDHGDRDSLGIFQQRPSMGWGTAAQLQDPYYATNAFYNQLQKIPGYHHMRITEAAQAVQRSGFPDAYEDHEADARALASALTGYSPGGRFTCVAYPSQDLRRQRPMADGLTPRTDAVRRNLERAFGDLSFGGFAPGGVRGGRRAGSAYAEGRALDILLGPVDAATRREGWAIAQYLVAHADQLHLDHVGFDGKVWTSGSASSQGWRRYHAGNSSVLERRDRVHVDVLAGH